MYEDFYSIQNGAFWAYSRMEGKGGGQKGPPPLLKICHTYLTMMEFGTVTPYLKNTQKLYELRDTPLEFC